jgi:glutamate-1-semialdehyde aminotransferase
LFQQLGAHTTREQELAELICKRFKSIENVRFTNSGTEATLLALMTAVRYTGRNKILVFGGGYHGTGFSGFGVNEDGILLGSELQHLASLRAPYVCLVYFGHTLERITD